MRGNFDTQLPSSFLAWLNNKLDKEGEAFSTQNVTLFKQTDPSRSTLNVYASPYKGWVYDSCATSVISGVYTTSGQYLTRSSGIEFDFNNGRVLSSGNWGQTLTGTISRKEYNVYFTTDEKATLFLENGTDSNKNVKFTETGVTPYDFAAPCIFVTAATAQNVPFAFGGIDNSQRTFRLLVVSDNNYHQEALKGLLVDSARQNFPLIEDSATPFTFYGDLKSGYYNYCDIRNTYGCASGAYIKEVNSFKIPVENNATSMLLSAFEVKLEKIR